MSKKISMVSDITGKGITNHVTVRVSKTDHGIRLNGNLYFGDTVLDVDESELPTMFDKIRFVPSVTPEMKALIGEVGMASAAFFSKGKESEDK